MVSYLFLCFELDHMFKEIANRLRKLSPQVMEAKILKAMKRNSKTILDLNKSQLMQGEDSNGEMLAPYRSDSYADFKQTLNPLGVTDLKLKGKFYGGFFLVADKFPMYVFSRDGKTRQLAGKYGSDIFGLTEDSQDEVNKTIVLPEIQSSIMQALHV